MSLVSSKSPSFLSLVFGKPQEVENATYGDGLDALAGLAGGPSFAVVEFLFLLVEGFLDVPAQAATWVDCAG